MITLAETAYFTQHGIEFPAEMTAMVSDFECDDGHRYNTSSIPVLIKATYGTDSNKIDVTKIVQFMLLREGNQRLTLRAPPGSYENSWYSYLFGYEKAWKKTRPAKKTLIIEVRDHFSTNGNVNGDVKSYTFKNNVEFVTLLRVDRE